MKRRVICILLSALIFVSLISGAVTQVSAASNMKTSEKAIEILKLMEGFVSMPYADNGQYSVGYGSRCEAGEYPDGITKAEADALLRKYLTEMEASVNRFADRYSLTFTQNQFDALMLFTYNCGPNWTNSSSDFRQSVIDSDTGNDFIYYITRWCTDGTNVLPGLVTRRLAEADMYLNNYYSKVAPSNFTYVLFNTNGGNSCDSKIQGYDASEPADVKAVPAYTGYRFLGWYTAANGGAWITKLDANTAGDTLYAHWQKDEGDVDEDGNILGDTVSYQRTASGSESLTVYAAPSAGAETVKTLEKDTAVSIVADYIDNQNVKWGKLAEGGWINLSGTTAQVTAAEKPDRPVVEPESPEAAPETEKPVDVMVTNNYVNVRSGAGTGNALVGTAHYGNKLTITETKMVGNYKWGKFTDGWICLMYTNYDQVMEDLTADTTTVTATGTIINCNSLRIRSGAGTNYDVVGTLAKGTKVEITQQKDVYGIVWGRISTGWICLSYVDLKPVSSDDDKDDTQPGTDTTNPEEGDSSTTQTPDTSGKVTGTVVCNAFLNVRSGAGIHNALVGTLARESKVEILEQTTVGGTAWGRTAKGWICMDYVQLNSAGSGSKVTGTVDCNSYVNVRSAAGIQNALIGTLAKGTKVEILDQTTVNGVAWGRISRGWICMEYVELDKAGSGNTTTDKPAGDTNTGTGNTTTDKPAEDNSGSDNTTSDNTTSGGTTTTAIATGKVVGTNALRLRSGAGTTNAILGTLTEGTKVTIYEKTTVKGMVWGRIDGGWISLSYVQLDASSDGTVIKTGTVNTKGLRIRSAAGTTNAIVGSYNKGDKVEILETTKVGDITWGRTAKGWICLVYVD